MSDPERLLLNDATDEVSSLEQELLRSLEPSFAQKDELWGGVMARVTMVASAATAASVLAHGTQAAAGAEVTSAATALGGSGAACTGVGTGAAAGTSTGLLSAVSAQTITWVALVTLPVVLAGTYLSLFRDKPAERSADVSGNAQPFESIQPTPTVAPERAAEKVERVDPTPPPPGQAELETAAPRMPSAPSTSPSSLAEEDRLLRGARSEFKQGNYDAALRALRTLERRYPKGILAQEREVLRIAILKEQGRKSQAEERVQSFRERYPDSPYEAEGTTREETDR